MPRGSRHRADRTAELTSVPFRERRDYGTPKGGNWPRLTRQATLAFSRCVREPWKPTRFFSPKLSQIPFQPWARALFADRRRVNTKTQWEPAKIDFLMPAFFVSLC